MQNAIIRIRCSLDRLNPAEYSVASYVLKFPEECALMNVRQLAEASYVSTAAVLRMCRAIGYSGYREFRRALTVSNALNDEKYSLANEAVCEEDSAATILRKVTSANIRSLQETMQLLDVDVLEQCAELIEKSDRVLLFGLGASFVAARDFYQKLLRLNKECILNEDWHLQLVTARNATEHDVAIIISYSGQTTEMIKCMEQMKENRTRMIAITRSTPSRVSSLADLCLYVSSNESLFRSGAMASRIAQLNVIDILYTLYARTTHENSLKMLRKTHIVKP